MNLSLLKQNPNWAEVIVSIQLWNARLAKTEGNRPSAAYWLRRARRTYRWLFLPTLAILK
jgi:hypothetical protein